MRALIAVIAYLFVLVSASAHAQQLQLDPENTIYLDVGNAKETYGRIVIKLRPDLAPNHVARIKELTRQNFYDGIYFHRVIAGFMAQTGDPRGTGEGGSKLPNLKAEFTDTPHYRGVVSMARAEGEDSANSQFFIMLNDNMDLNGRYTVWGEVVSGIQYVDRIKLGDPKNNGAVTNPDRIVRMRVAADVKN